MNWCCLNGVLMPLHKAQISPMDRGFLFGDGVGRIGVAVFDEKTIYAIVDNQFRRPIKEKKKNVGIDKNYFAIGC